MVATAVKKTYRRCGRLLRISSLPRRYWWILISYFGCRYFFEVVDSVYLYIVNDSDLFGGTNGYLTLLKQSSLHILGSFAKLRWATIRFFMSTLLSVRPSVWNNSALTGRIFLKSWEFC